MDRFRLLAKNVDMLVSIRTARFLRHGVNLRDQLCAAFFPAASSSTSAAREAIEALTSSYYNNLKFKPFFPMLTDNLKYEEKYCDQLRSICELHMDQCTSTLLTFMALFNDSCPDLEDRKEINKVQDYFSLLLYRYLCSEIGDTNAIILLPQYKKAVKSLEVMAEIMANRKITKL